MYTFFLCRRSRPRTTILLWCARTFERRPGAQVDIANPTVPQPLEVILMLAGIFLTVRLCISNNAMHSAFTMRWSLRRLILSRPHQNSVQLSDLGRRSDSQIGSTCQLGLASTDRIVARDRKISFCILFLLFHCLISSPSTCSMFANSNTPCCERCQPPPKAVASTDLTHIRASPPNSWIVARLSRA